MKTITTTTLGIVLLTLLMGQSAVLDTSRRHAPNKYVEAVRLWKPMMPEKMIAKVKEAIKEPLILPDGWPSEPSSSGYRIVGEYITLRGLKLARAGHPELAEPLLELAILYSRRLISARPHTVPMFMAGHLLFDMTLRDAGVVAYYAGDLELTQRIWNDANKAERAFDESVFPIVREAALSAKAAAIARALATWEKEVDPLPLEHPLSPYGLSKLGCSKEGTKEAN